MNNNNLQDLFHLVRAFPALTAASYIRLCRLAKRHRRLCERKDIQPFSEANESANEKAIAATEKAFAFELALAVPDALPKNQRDYRGATLFFTHTNKADKWPVDRTYYL